MPSPPWTAEAAQAITQEVSIFSRRIRLLTLFGFDVWIDASWVLLAVLVTWTLATAVFPALTPQLTPAIYWWMAAVAAIGLFFSIILHEMAHALVARRYDTPVRGVTLFIFGGVAEMESEPASPKGEFLMAAAGPTASLLIAALSFLSMVIAAAADTPDAVLGTLWYLGFVNGMLALFNLVPAFPLDGGRVLRAALWLWRGDLSWATWIAARAGSLFGLVLIGLGVFGVVTGDFIGGMWRFLIGLFLMNAAEAGYGEVVARAALAGVPVARIMSRNPIAVTPETSVAAFIDDFVYGRHHRSFPVTRNGVLVGCVGTEQAAQLDRAAWASTPVAAIMIACTASDTIAPETAAVAALTQMQRGGRGRLWVVEDGRLVGVLTLHDMLELLAAKREMAGGRRNESRPRGRTFAGRDAGSGWGGRS